jgi:UTP:GlnB (protein PII) uridylyltransferase
LSSHSTVDKHTLQVVDKLKSLQEFTERPAGDKDKIELAAYLHGIGKGPKARRANNGGVQKVDPDHPVRAMPMMVDLLTKQVRKVGQEDAKCIVKLVCYHDLVGEVLGRRRGSLQHFLTAQHQRRSFASSLR